ncbi:MAG: putative toxin-antitoxin system toxin component, PIN family [Betaproteobacteria bacterium]|nr:putative toxin-antitoxin system toxin component, PIN family [Betaproteobacteria bacterium]MDH5219629.1 putative toxin-antitoxin system toxin component, PIN family [Betaproteobacteria bacterium]MDH5350017.1 putative toxin-antitoxin system toxin component, PIN family [Betaproteobacteria bacterium]
MQPLKVVLDTNIWLDWLVFDDPAIAALREARAAGRIDIVIDEACEAELVRVLAYDLGARTLDAAAQSACVARCRALAIRVGAHAGGGLPACRDPDDQKFLALAAGAGAAVLVSRDQALLELAPRVDGLRIVPPERFEAPA